MGFFDFIQKKLAKRPTDPEQSDIKISIQYNNSTLPTAKIQMAEGISDYDLEIEYLRLSTSGDENVCQMCAQFEGKLFHSADAPKLPLCPSCACSYEYYYKGDLSPDAVISSKNDFTLPAECTSLFYKHHQKFYEETDINKKIRMCEIDLKNLPAFMTPYLSAGFSAPVDLICRDMLPKLYIQLGKWEKAERAIKICIAEKAYYPEDGSKELADFESYHKVAVETLSYISQNPGCLQRNIYKTMEYEGTQREQLKDFLRNSNQIEKVKYNNTNQLFCKTEKNKE